MLLLLTLPALALRPPVVPGHAAPSHTRAPDDVHLPYKAGEQWRLAIRAAAFQETWGSSHFSWDPRNATPRFVGLPGIPDAHLRSLVSDLARLSRISPSDLHLDRTIKRPDRTLYSYTRTHQGIPVHGDRVLIVAQNGRIGAAWVRLTPGNFAPALPGEVILPLPDGHAVLAFPAHSGTEQRWVDRLGRIVYRYDTRKYADLSVEYEATTVGDPILTGPARGVTMTDADGATAITAADGSHALSGSLDAWLDGPQLGVLNNGAAIHVTGTDSFTITHSDVPPAAADVLYNFYDVRDWLEARWPTHDWLPERVPATVLIPGVCNAYYTGGTINFYAESSYCVDLGRVADVVFHEYGHGVHDYIIASGTFAGDVSEGSADFTAATLLDAPWIGNGAQGPGTYFREIDTDKIYPADSNGQVHNDGLIWASFLWNLREDWRVEYGETSGVEMVDVLFLGTLEQGPTLTDLYNAVIVADDDDGDFTNGTPHGCELADLLNYHGLGPGVIGSTGFDHTPLGPQLSSTPGYPFAFDLYSLTPDCSGLDADSVALWYTTDDSLPLPGSTVYPEVPEDSGDSGGRPEPTIAGYDGWVSVPLTLTGVTYSGTIARQPATSHVRYFMQASSTDGTETITTHEGDADALYAFWIGDRNAIWCEGFEAGFGDFTHGGGSPSRPDTEGRFLDEWVTGVPSSGSWDPSSAPEGSAIAATVLDGDYSANNAQYLSSPTVDLSAAGPMLLFSQQRWLTVEDGLYDRAGLWINEALVYGNAVSRSGSEATLDGEWTHQDIDLDAMDTLDRTAVRVDWTLTTDVGLEYGGWALDAVCFYDLDDVPGHYRAENLTATDDQAQISVSWENPWMTPLGHVRLVRNTTAIPTGPDDGDVVLDDTAPVIGAATTWVDPDAGPGDTVYYALFAGPAVDDWQGGAVDGENADEGSVPEIDTGEPPVDDTADTGEVPEDSEPVAGDDTGESPKTGGCGCGGPGAPGMLGVLALAGVLRRSRLRS